MEKKEVQTTLSVLALFSLFLYLFFSVRYTVETAALLLVLSLFENPIAKGIAYLWLSFSRFIGFINSKIILTLLFYLFIVPISLLFRLFNSDKKRFFFTRSDATYFVDSSDTFTKSHFEQPF